jgi:hypothetical protein
VARPEEAQQFNILMGRPIPRQPRILQKLVKIREICGKDILNGTSLGKLMEKIMGAKSVWEGGGMCIRLPV